MGAKEQRRRAYIFLEVPEKITLKKGHKLNVEGWISIAVIVITERSKVGFELQYFYSERKETFSKYGYRIILALC